MINQDQAAISWRASGNRQISLNASAERAFANFRDKKHRILQLQIFATKIHRILQLQILQQNTVVFYNCIKTSIFTVLALIALR